MTTDEKILWLCEHGFTLPDGLVYDSGGIPDRNDPYFRPTRPSWNRSPTERADLCAAHFAREWRAYHPTSSIRPQWFGLVGCGESAEAIDALYQAVKANQWPTPQNN